MISALFARAVILVFGTLFPAYYSYKAVKTKNVKEYVKWMMYWIVFAFFTCAETITDLFLAFWFPFYYELKILLVLWLLSPATRGSSLLYRKFVHPWLTQREGEIDECIAKAKEQGYSTVLTLGTKGVNYATSVIMQTAIKGGGGIVNQLKRSYSVGQLNESDETDTANNNNNAKGNARYPRQTSSPTVAAVTDVQMAESSGGVGRNAPIDHDLGSRGGAPLRINNGRKTNAQTYIDDVVDAAFTSGRDRPEPLYNRIMDNAIYEDLNDNIKVSNSRDTSFNGSHSQLRFDEDSVLSPTVTGFSIDESIREEVQSSDDDYFPEDVKVNIKSKANVMIAESPNQTRRSTRKRVQRTLIS